MSSPDLHLTVKDEEMEPLDGDHRKRRRNRTTMSCLNCHASKRRCDRKRPCSRCISLGLTGLCVYETDDITMIRDPSVDESTRLRRRIAELESLVRELRGKPSPRWAEASKDMSNEEKWHSRAKPNPPPVPSVPRMRPHSPGGESHGDGRALSMRLPPIKTEHLETTRAPPSSLYRLSPSPVPSSTIPYRDYEPTSATSSYDGDLRQPYSAGSHASPVSSYGHGQYHLRGATQSNEYRNDCEDDRGYHSQSYTTPDTSPSLHTTQVCGCRQNPNLSYTYSALSQQVSTTLGVLHDYDVHPHGSLCDIHSRLSELEALMHETSRDNLGAGLSYSIPVTNDQQMIARLPPPHNSYHPGVQPSPVQEQWHGASQPGYSPYFQHQTKGYGG